MIRVVNLKNIRQLNQMLSVQRLNKTVLYILEHKWIFLGEPKHFCYLLIQGDTPWSHYQGVFRHCLQQLFISLGEMLYCNRWVPQLKWCYCSYLTKKSKTWYSYMFSCNLIFSTQWKCHCMNLSHIVQICICSHFPMVALHLHMFSSKRYFLSMYSFKCKKGPSATN